MILQYIKDFGSITSYEAYIDLGITQLATRIKELKEEGYSFNYEWISKKNRYGKSVAFKKYKLEETNENRNTVAM
jgi:esterase/lipase superfamily enzyme